MAVCLIAVVVLFLVWQGCGKGSVKSATKNSFDEVTSQLDKGGNFYLYASTEKLIQTVDEFAASMRKIIATPTSPSEPVNNDGLKVFDFIYNLYKKSGLNEISGIGISSVAIAEDLNHSKIVVHHYKDRNTGLIWQMSAKEPGPQDELGMLPANTVLAGFGDFDVKQFWTFLTRELTTSNIPEIREGFTKMGPELLKEGIDLNKLLNSLKGRMGYVITLDNNVRKALPIGTQTMEIPDPALALIMSVTDDYLFNLLANKMPPAYKSERDGIKKISIPMPPMPITVEPVIVLTQGHLIFASNSKIVDSMLATKKSGQGLTAGEEFKQLSIHMPEKGNGFRFISSRLMETFNDIMQKLMAEKGSTSQADAEALNLLSKLFPKKIAMYLVTQHNAEGSITFVNHTMGVETLLLMPAMVTTGMVAAIAIPNIMAATSKGKQKATMGDLKSIATAIESYIVDNNKAPVGNSVAELKLLLEPFYIRQLPLKDAWGNDFLYTYGTGKNKVSYAVASPGKDGIFNGWEQRGEYLMAGDLDFNNDIIIADMTFVFGPMVK